ncbi:unnamed protein product [Paramecium octaurelia]|uniref:Uncharacterized protein n=1 Tax=Paramecium octaurelia TaxID=43137 RepID=A0A8S1X1A2_PAROT|nr:unnamed protein product [Paramecium octaurelia]CAD8192040.1 unnamed protein product [Paramecium octaurelia]
MKYILIIVLLISATTTRSIHLNSDEKMSRCIAKLCRNQIGACIRIKGCADNFKSCANELEKDEDIEKFDLCLDKVPQSYTLMECIQSNCINIESNKIEQHQRN